MKLSTQDLRQIRLSRQHLTEKTDKHAVCRDLNGIQAQFTVNVEHSLKIRCNEKIIKDGYGDGLVKNWTVRGTVHVFNESDLPLYKCQDERNPYRSHDWGKTKLLAQRHCRIHPDRLEYIAKLIIDKVSDGVTAREDIKKECYSAGVTEDEGAYVFSQWGGLMRSLCERGFLCYKAQEKKEFMICPPYTPMDRDEAPLEQVRRYFTNYAPATTRDASYFFGWPQTIMKGIMHKLPLERTEVDGKTHYQIGALKSDYPAVPHCIPLAGFDQLMLGYRKQESVFLPQKCLRGIFNLAGIVMPAILLDGTVAGRWKRKGANILFELFGDVPAKSKKHIESAAETLFGEIKRIEWKMI